PGNWVGRNSSVEAELSTYFVNPAIGYTLPDFGIGRIHVGVGLQVAVTGNFRYQAAVTTFTPEGTFNLDTRMQEISFGFNAGLIYSPAEIIALGFAYRSPVEVEFEGEADFVDLPVGFPPTASVSTRIEFPASWTAAVNLRLHPRWRAEIDVVWWRWSSYERLNFIFDQTIVALSSNLLVDRRNFEDSWEFKGGIEYTGLLDDRLTLRSGAAYQQSPIEDAFVDAKNPGADSWFFSGGFTYKLTSAVEIDGAYIFLRAAERRVTDTHASLDGIYTGHAHMPSLGITLNF
ncbi:MAG: outer membrane protein transport protein, partial [Balneolaceae bacterium]|nr:outer membrane protein transport protein [Balneolaceae bacterium]